MAAATRPTEVENATSIALPSGWEAKYDGTQKRYFYIDHLNKTTSWVDPRIKILQQQQLDHQKAAHDRVTQQQEQQAINQAKHDQQNQQQQQAQQLKLAQQTALQHQPLLGLGQQQHAGQVWPQSSPYVTPARLGGEGAPTTTHASSAHPTPSHGRLTPSGTAAATTGTGWQADAGKSVRFKVMIDDLTARFPGTGKEMIAEIVSECDDEVSARRLLIEMGCKEVPSPIRPGPTGYVTHVPSPGYAAHAPSNVARAPSPAARSSSPVPVASPNAFAGLAPTASPRPAAALSPAASKPSASPSGQIPFSSSLKNRSGAAAAMTATQKAAAVGGGGSGGGGHTEHKTGQSKTSGGGSRSKTSTSREPTPDQKKKLREKFEKEFPKTAKSVITMALDACVYDETLTRDILKSVEVTSTTAPPTAIVSGGNSGSTMPTAHDAAGSTTAVVSAVGSGGNVAGGSVHTSIPAALSNESRSTSEVIGHTRDERSTQYMSVQVGPRCLAKGHDPSLAHGPNKKLLMPDYVRETGANPSNHVGPRVENYHGPRSELHKGVQADEARGPATRMEWASED